MWYLENDNLSLLGLTGIHVINHLGEILNFPEIDIRLNTISY